MTCMVSTTSSKTTFIKDSRKKCRKMSDVKRLVVSFVQFLGDQLRNGDLSSDAKESIEVAIQCLESAYGVTSNDGSKNEISSLPSLLEIFSEATRDFQHMNDEVPTEVPDASEKEKAEAEKLKNEGNNLMKTDKYDEALDCYTKAITLDGKNAVYFCNRAAVYIKLNNHKDAIEDCIAAIKIDPSYSKAYGRMGLAHASLGEYVQAKKCFQQAIQLDPENESYINNLKVAEEKIKASGASSGAGTEGGPGPGMNLGAPFDFSAVLGNPLLMNMATQIMQDPNMQNLMSGVMSGSLHDGGEGMDALLRAGQQLAAQMQASNPDLVEQFRRQMDSASRQNPPRQQ